MNGMYTKNITFLSLLFLTFSLSSRSAETKMADQTVERVELSGPFALSEPVRTDPVGKDGKPFSFDGYLDKLEPNTAVLFQENNARTLTNGEPLPALSGQSAVSFLRFTLSCPNYFKGRLKISKLKKYKVFTDGRSGGESLSLEPGRHNIVVACLQKDGTHDTLSLSLSTEAGQAVINSTGKRSYTLNDVTDGRHYTGVSVSPSGKYAIIYYSMTYPSGKVDKSAQLVEVTTNRILLPDAGSQSYHWCTGADRLYYIKKTDSKHAVYTMDVPSFKETKVAADIPDFGKISLSPDMTYIVYSTDDKAEPRNKDFKHFAMPDDRLYDSRTHDFINLYNVRTGLTRRVTFGQQTVRCSDISRDSRYLLLMSGRMVLHRYPFDSYTVCRYDVTDGHIDTLIRDTAGIDFCRFSPDGRRLLVQATADAFGGIGKDFDPQKPCNVYDKQLFLFDIASHKVTPLTKQFNPSVDKAVWSPHDGMIYLTAEDGSRTCLYRLNPQTDEIRRYPYPVDLIQNFSIADGSDIVVYWGQGATYARKMYWARLGDMKGRSTPLGTIDFEQDFKDVAIPSCHTFNYKAERGDSIHGFYYLPPDFDATKQYPMITYYYGGCMPTKERLEMNYPFAVWAAQGYVVYVVEPSGAVGYGQEFASRHVNTWGKESSDDILQGVKAFCAAHPWVRKDRVACIGASYGGFMTEYLLTRTDFFRTAVAHAGISDITGYWGAGNWGYTYGEVASAKSFPWNNKEMYVEQSPLYHADKIHTPVLLIQGSLDDNVPANQAWELYMALKILNRDAEYIQVQGENHVIRDYLKQKEWQRTICAWFARYLKDDPAWWNDMYKDK